MESKLEIQFGGEVNSYIMENLIKSYYRLSRQRKYEHVIFNCNRVKFFGLLELSLLALWIYELVEKKKVVRFVIPEDAALFSFLLNYEFLNFLVSQGVLEKGTKLKRPYTPFSSQFFPFKFSNNIEFINFLSELNDPERLGIYFKEIRETKLIRNNVIHSVILKEIGDNIFIHSGSTISSYAMTKFDKKYFDKGIKSEYFYLKKFEHNDIINIVISDKGKGLYNKLLGSYHADKILPQNQKNENPSEIDIIKYAFLKHTTSRTDEERKKELKKFIENTNCRYPLPTGLYKVKNIVKQYNGFLYVRSGKSIVCYDYSMENNEKISTNKDEETIKELADFPGTQFKIYLPVRQPKRAYKSFYSSEIQVENYGEGKILGYLTLNDFIDEAFDEIDPICISKLQYLLDNIENLKLSHKMDTGAILVDVANFKNVKSKNIKYLVMSNLMAAQSENVCFILVNIEKEAIVEIHDDYFGDEFLDFFLPILSFDKTFSPFVIGIKQLSYKDIIDNINAKSRVDKINFVNSYKHIFHDYGGVSLKYSKDHLIHNYSNNLKKSISRKILDDKSNIYYPRQKVLVPNRYYCKGFFELINIYDHILIFNEIISWFIINLIMTKPDCIITLGYASEKLIEEIYNYFESQNIQVNARKFNINTSSIHTDSFHLQDKISKTDSILMVTDVIGSSSTLITAIEEINRENIIKILTIVNATPSNTLFVNKINFPIESIVEERISYFTSMPKGWDYKDIKIFDVKSNRLLENKSLPEGPLWEKLSEKNVRDDDGVFTITINPFLENLVNTDNSYIYGHFESRSNHLLYLFNIKSLIKYFYSEISNCISSYLVDLNEKSGCYKEDNLFSYLLYPAFNPGLDIVAESICKKIPNIIPLPIEEVDLENGLHGKYDFSNTSVILIDDAFVTGTTIEKMIDISSERKAKHIFPFVLLKRGNAYQGRRLEKIKQYGESSIHSRYLADAEIPIFNEINCPICKKVREYEYIIKFLGDNPSLADFVTYVKLLVNNYETRQVRAVFNEKAFIEESLPKMPNKDYSGQDRPYFSKLNLRWKLEVALDNTSMRKNLAQFIKRKQDYPNAILTLIRILSDEKYYFIHNKRYFDKIFYKSFVPNLLATCDSYLDEVHQLYSTDIIAILDIIKELDESIFLEKYQKLLIDCQYNQEKFYSIVLILILCKVTEDNPLKISVDLNCVVQGISDEKLKTFLHNLSHLLSLKQKEIFQKANVALSVYRKSFITLHNINHDLEALEHYIDPENYDKEPFLENHSRFMRSLDSFLRDLKIFLDNLRSEKIYSRFINLLRVIEESKRDIVSIVSNGITKDVLKQYHVVVSHLKKIICMYDNDTLPFTLDLLKVDVTKMCYERLQQQGKFLRENNIDYDYFFPNIPCVVFGLTDSVFYIFHNLIENIYVHSKASKFIVWAILNEDEQILDILFIDNGNLSEQIQYGQGLLSVQRSVKDCIGRFNIGGISDSRFESMIKAKFDGFNTGTVAEVSLSIINIKG